MAWLVEDTAKPAPAKRSNAKRKKGSSLNSAATPTTNDTTSQHDNNNNNSDGEHDTTKGDDGAKKELSKSQRKRARHQADSVKSMTEDEKSWSQLSLFNVPDLPSNPEPVLISKKAKNRNNAAAKGKKGGNGGKKLPGGGEIVVADYGRMDDWGWTPVSTEGIMMDDMDGFLCLEELDGVNVAFEGTETTGKTIVFKHDSKAAAAKKGKNVRHSEPLFVEDGEVFYDIDTFDEDVLIKQKQEGTQDVDGDAVMSETEGDSNDNVMDIDEEEAKPAVKKAEAPVKEKKEKKEKKQKKESKEQQQPAKTESKEQEASDIAPESEATEKGTKEGVVTAPKKLSKKEKATLRAEEFKAKRAEAKVAKAALKAEEEPKIVYDPMEGVDLDFDISEWKDYKLSPMIENGLKKQKFSKPSQIQEQALPLALAGRDVIGVAETGSGKTLAFGFPIIQFLAQQAAFAKESGSPLNESLTALILTPTRELAIQVKDHLVAFTQFTGHHVVPIVGGMSVQKQTRQLDRNPAIVVATPGRLWELISTNPIYSERLVQARFLVLDEADRMLESGHFEELSNILKLLERKREKTSDWDQHIKAAEASKVANGEEEETSKDGEANAVKPTSIARTDYESTRQTFIFTATLSKELSLNLTRKRNKAKSAEQSTDGTLEDLMERIEFHDESPALVNVGSEKIVASKLLEAKIDCLTNEKDLYLYYFAKKYPGRTLVFVNSIDAIRHLVPMMQLLGIEALGMHAQMQQRQRLKNLDRFKSNPYAFMIASDVAARGLDIPLVDHVIHYQVPRSGDIYVHRSGRTARANNEGISLLICGPDEVQLYRKMCITLKKDQTGGIPDFPVDRGVITDMKKRVALAKKIDEQEHRVQKSAHQDDWMLKSAEAMDIIIDEDVLNAAPKSSKNKGGDDEDNSAMTGRKNKIKGMRAELKAMLQTRLIPQGVSAKYITSGSIRDLADRLRDSANHNPMMPAHIQTTALADIKAHKKNTKKTTSTPTTAN
ncbi:ATP-dependent RNA helicase [Mortierella sp. AD032]|nr:ATP-dependent RNA helicase [Mortierella sp. AD032]